MTLAEDIKREARTLGFQAVGISRVPDTSSRFEVQRSGAGLDSGDSSCPSQTSNLEPRTPVTWLLRSRLLEWLRRGFHGTMSWIAREPERRADPRTILAGCRSVISVGMNYYTEHRADERP